MSETLHLRKDGASLLRSMADTLENNEDARIEVTSASDNDTIIDYVHQSVAVMYTVKWTVNMFEQITIVDAMNRGIL